MAVLSIIITPFSFPQFHEDYEGTCRSRNCQPLFVKTILNFGARIINHFGHNIKYFLTRLIIRQLSQGRHDDLVLV